MVLGRIMIAHAAASEFKLAHIKMSLFLVSIPVVVLPLLFRAVLGVKFGSF